LIGDMYERLGPRVVVAIGTAAMATGVAALGAVTQPWQLYPAFVVMSLGWGAMSGAAINIILAPWWERRRGLAVSLAFNGATLGGVLIGPTLIPLIGALGLGRALAIAALTHLVVMLGASVAILRRAPAELGLRPDGDAGPPRTRLGTPRSSPPARRDAMRTWRFWSVSVPFALGLAAQVGVLTHLVALATPALGVTGAGRAVSIATAAAVIGRLLTGLVVDRLNRRVVTSATLVIQIVGLLVLQRIPAPSGVYVGCVLFGLGVGNLTTLPGLVVAQEWPREHFASLVALVVGINQLTSAFGPPLVGVLRDRSEGSGSALGACRALQAVAAITILLAPAAPRPSRPRSEL